MILGKALRPFLVSSLIQSKSTMSRVPSVTTAFSEVQDVHQTIVSSARHRFKSTTSLDASQVEPWYVDDDLSRSIIPDATPNTLENAKYLIIQDDEKGTGHWYLNADGKSDCEEAKPLFLSHDELKYVVNTDASELQEGKGSSLVWIGEKDQINFYAVYITKEDLDIEAMKGKMNTIDRTEKKRFAHLREFGDRIISKEDAALYSTANGLIEFHKSHKFCSYCGSPTIARKGATSRICSNHKRTYGGTCKSPSIYPRIDVASIMLITSPCENYALLGRKSNWPEGRYSTLAGFLEVGETIEQCCIRETFEESGIEVERESVKFVKSQPWLFPRSLSKYIFIENSTTGLQYFII